MCIQSVYTLLKVVGYYDLSVLSMSVMGFQKKVWMGGWVGGVRCIQVFFWDFGNLFNFAKPLNASTGFCDVHIFTTFCIALCPNGHSVTHKLILFVIECTRKRKVITVYIILLC